jgi:hypothetical protein
MKFAILRGGERSKKKTAKMPNMALRKYVNKFFYNAFQAPLNV